MSNLKVLVGADPEAFVFNARKQPWVPVGYVLGTKTAPFIVKDGAIQIDGLAVEWNIDPASNEEDFVSRLKSVFSEIQKKIPNFLTSTVEIVPTAEFVKQTVQVLQPDQVALGCMPDWNAYTEEINPPPSMPNNDPYQQLMRTAAGHVHAGWTKNIKVQDENHKADCFLAVKQLDYYLGIPSLYWDDDKKRRELYGKAGACRVKPYGVEYRVLSNQWLRGIKNQEEEDLMGFVYRQTVKALKDLKKGVSAFDRYGDIARTLINAGNRPGKDYDTIRKEYFPELPERYLKKAA